MTLRGPHLLPVAMFFGSFAWSFVYVSLPFHIQRISTVGEVATLQWTGWILGVSSLVTVATAPVWGRWGERGNPKTFYVVVEALQGIAFLGLAIARTLPELFVARFVLGFMGAASTFAFMIAGRAPDAGAVRRHVAAVQSAMTVGQVLGPLAGAIAAARLGFRTSFVLGAVVLWACSALVWWGVPLGGESARPRQAGQRARLGEVAAVAIVVLGGSIHVFFLTAILPKVLPGLGIAPGDTLEVGGLVIFVSGAAAALGALAAPRLSDLLPERRLLAGLLVGSSVAVTLLAAAGSLWQYATLRFLQVLCVAPVFPLVVARIAVHASGQAIGTINSARIGASFVGPVLATNVLAWSSPTSLYVLLGLIGLACVPAVTLPAGRGRRRP